MAVNFCNAKGFFSPKMSCGWLNKQTNVYLVLTELQWKDHMQKFNPPFIPISWRTPIPTISWASLHTALIKGFVSSQPPVTSSWGTTPREGTGVQKWPLKHQPRGSFLCWLRSGYNWTFMTFLKVHWNTETAVRKDFFFLYILIIYI